MAMQGHLKNGFSVMLRAQDIGIPAILLSLVWNTGRLEKCVSGYMWIVVKYFLFCLKFLHGDNKEIICPADQGNPLEIL